MPKYNVIFITVDSWNRNFVGSYNETAKVENITPKIDGFAAQGITFSSAFSPSVKTSASFLSILSGCCPCKYGDWFVSISEKRKTISEILNSNGYSTYGFTSNPCTSSLRKYDKGFDVFKDTLIIKSMKGQSLELMLAFKTLFKNPYSPAADINRQVLSSIDHKKKPYFVWLHYMDLHGPYIDEDGWQFIERISAGRLWKKAIENPEKITDKEKQKLIDVYKAKNKYLDHHIGALLREQDDNKTIIIITADHGDVFGERGYFAHPFFFYNEMINVPLFIKLPAEINVQNKVCNDPVSLMDIVPTLLDVLKIGAEIPFDGNSLLPLINDRPEEYKTKYIISEISRDYACVIKNKWKLIAKYSDTFFELYNLEEDPEEKNNLIDNGLDIAQELKDVIKEHIITNRP